MGEERGKNNQTKPAGSFEFAYIIHWAVLVLMAWDFRKKQSIGVRDKLQANRILLPARRELTRVQKNLISESFCHSLSISML